MPSSAVRPNGCESSESLSLRRLVTKLAALLDLKPNFRSSCKQAMITCYNMLTAKYRRSPLLFWHTTEKVRSSGCSTSHCTPGSHSGRPTRSPLHSGDSWPVLPLHSGRYGWRLSLPLHSGRNPGSSTWYKRETYRKGKDQTKNQDPLGEVLTWILGWPQKVPYPWQCTVKATPRTAWERQEGVQK